MNSFVSRLGTVKSKLVSYEKFASMESMFDKDLTDTQYGLAILNLIEMLETTFKEELQKGRKFRVSVKRTESVLDPYKREIREAKKAERLASGEIKPEYGECSKMVAEASKQFPNGIGATEFGKILAEKNPGKGDFRRWRQRAQNAADHGYVERRNGLIFPKTATKVVSIKSRKVA